MQDWELIQRSAKLMGFTPLRWVPPSPGDKDGHFLVKKPGKTSPEPWNPKTNTVDAFNLGVELRLFRGFNEALAQAIEGVGDDNSMANTRLGILRASASFTPSQ